MYQNRIVEMILHLPRRIVRELLGYVQLAPLPLINRYGRSPVTQPGGPVVSLTTYGQRAQTVYLVIESIARGEARPSILILWIDEVHLFNNLPATIRRLQRRGLEVKLCKNYGPHKKYYPYIESQNSFDLPLVTADDDILYPRYWLKKLVEANREHPETVNCYFAGKVEFDQRSGRMCMKGKSCRSTDPSFCYHPLGGTGVIYPPPYLMALKRAGATFESCCPTQDDIWHHVMALRAGYKVRQILPRPPYFSFQSIPGTHRTALNGRGIDLQISATYKESDIQLLRAGCGVTPR
ncbi:MAG TPA: hypothetical protein VGT08_09800 [Terracidiphilus sp.]|nr:hypothetical protein [Terracidiphilus sp.]